MEGIGGPTLAGAVSPSSIQIGNSTNKTRDRSDVPSVDGMMREFATVNAFSPNNDESAIFGACLILANCSVPLSSPNDEIIFNDSDDRTVEAATRSTSPTPAEGNFGENAAAAPQDVSASAEVRPSSRGTEDGNFVIDVETFVEEPPEGLQLTSREVIDTIDRHLSQEDITSDMRSALELIRDGFERAMESLQGNDFGANERAVDAMEKAFDAAMAAREVATDAHELDFASEIQEMAGNLRSHTPEETGKAILGVMMSIFALLDLRDGPELRGPTWQGGLAHAVLDPATPAYAKKKATRILNMTQRYKEIMKQQERREVCQSQTFKKNQPASPSKQSQQTQTPKQKEQTTRKDPGTSSISGKGEESDADEHSETNGPMNLFGAKRNSENT